MVSLESVKQKADENEANATSPLKIVALGDSLTRGYQPAGNLDVFFGETPYTDFLRERCGGVVEFVNRGINGDMTSGMVARFDRDVLDVRPDYMLLLGGANDIGWGVPNAGILDNLTKMLRRAAGAGIKPCACTVPPVRGWDEGNRLRLELNSKLAEHCAAESIPWVDLYAPLIDGPGGNLRPEFSGDGLHLTEAGYLAMAEAIWEGFVSRLL